MICYFLGNISTGLLIGKLTAQIDIRQHGSGNAGTTNVMRTLGWVPSLLTLAGDVLKAVLAVVIGRAIAGEIGWIVGAVAVLLGHNWPVVFGFKGGKGMACSLGIILATEPLFALIVLAVQVLVLVITRYMSVASLTTSVLYPVRHALCGLLDPGRLPGDLLPPLEHLPPDPPHRKPAGLLEDQEVQPQKVKMAGILLTAAGLAGYAAVRHLRRKDRLDARAELPLCLACVAAEALGVYLMIF